MERRKEDQRETEGGREKERRGRHGGWRKSLRLDLDLELCTTLVMTLDKLVSFNNLPPLLFFPSPHPCSDSLPDSDLPHGPVFHNPEKDSDDLFRTGPAEDDMAVPRADHTQSLMISIKGAGFIQMRVWGS